MPSHLAWTLFDFFDDYDPSMAEPAPPLPKVADSDEDDGEST
jgi:hypothetical protein